MKLKRRALRKIRDICNAREITFQDLVILALDEKFKKWGEPTVAQMEQED